jgi:hypothetical protein
MTMPKADPDKRPASRPKNREVENEMVKVPPREGEPPRPATEPNASVQKKPA